MKRMLILASLIGLVLALAMLAPLAAPSVGYADNFTILAIGSNGGYNFTGFDCPGATGNGTNAHGIDNQNRLVGSYQVSGGSYYGFVGAVGSNTYTQVQYPGSTDTRVNGIGNPTSGNGIGPIVGSYIDSSGKRIAYISSDGGQNFTSFQNDSKGYTSADAINRNNTIVGTFADDTTNLTNLTGFYGPLNTYNLISYQGAVHTTGTGINAAGTMVGSYTTTINNITITHGFQLSADGQTYTAMPDAYSGNDAFNWARDINNNGIIAGTYGDPTQMHGYLYNIATSNYATIDLPASFGALSTDIDGTNDNGWLVGYYLGSDSAVHGFYAQPVPIPPSLVLLGSGLLGLIAMRKKYSGPKP